MSGPTSRTSIVLQLLEPLGVGPKVGQFDYCSHLTIVALAAPFILVIRWAAFKLLYPWVWSLAVNHLPESTAKITSAHKFMGYIWHAFWYTSVQLWGLHLMTRLPWSFLRSYDTSVFAGLEPCSNPWYVADNATDAPHSELRVFMMVQMSWYVAGTVTTVRERRDRGDFWMMILHHVLSTALIYGSTVAGAHRVGLTVTSCLDVTDVCLYLAKMAHILTSDVNGNALTQGMHRFQSVALSLLLVSWTLTRVVGLGIIVFQLGTFNIGTGHATLTFWWLWLQLALLLILQTVWALGILQMTISQIAKGSFHDFFHSDVGKNKKSDATVISSQLSGKQSASRASTMASG